MMRFVGILLMVFSPLLLIFIGFGIAIIADVAGNSWASATILGVVATTLSLALIIDLQEPRGFRTET
jgi:hypothetical protein